MACSFPYKQKRTVTYTVRLQKDKNHHKSISTRATLRQASNVTVAKINTKLQYNGEQKKGHF